MAAESEGTADPAECVLAIDPGRGKCGLAVVARGGHVLARRIVPTEQLCGAVVRLIALHQPQAVVMGHGTGSRDCAARLPVPVVTVDESHTSEQARARFVAETPPRGLERLLPRSLRTPNQPYDDYVAVILAERYWAGKQERR